MVAPESVLEDSQPHPNMKVYVSQTSVHPRDRVSHSFFASRGTLVVCV